MARRDGEPPGTFNNGWRNGVADQIYRNLDIGRPERAVPLAASSTTAPVRYSAALVRREPSPGGAAGRGAGRSSAAFPSASSLAPSVNLVRALLARDDGDEAGARAYLAEAAARLRTPALERALGLPPSAWPPSLRHLRDRRPGAGEARSGKILRREENAAHGRLPRPAGSFSRPLPFAGPGESRTSSAGVLSPRARRRRRRRASRSSTSSRRTGAARATSSMERSSPRKADGSEIDKEFVPVVLEDSQPRGGTIPPEMIRLAQKFEIQGFPTLVVARPEGKKAVKLAGWIGRDKTVDWIGYAPGRLVGDGEGARPRSRGERPMSTKILTRNNGPLVVEGDFTSSTRRTRPSASADGRGLPSAAAASPRTSRSATATHGRVGFSETSAGARPSASGAEALNPAAAGPTPTARRPGS